MIYYIAFSYPIITGILWEVGRKPQWQELFIWIFSPLFLPIYLGLLISKYYNE